MSFTHKLEVNFRSGNDIVTQTVEKSADGEDNRDIAVNDGQTDQETALAIDVSELKMLYIVADVAMTLETNNGSTPDDTFTLVAGEPIVWWTGAPWTNPLGTDVTSIFATNASGTNGTLKIRTLIDT